MLVEPCDVVLAAESHSCPIRFELEAVLDDKLSLGSEES